MQIKNIYTIRAQLLQTGLEMLRQDFGFMIDATSRVDFGRNGQTTLFPVGFAGEGFLLAADVAARCVDFVVALGLEVVEAFLVLGK
jgi:hypothetical protein